MRECKFLSCVDVDAELTEGRAQRGRELGMDANSGRELGAALLRTKRGRDERGEGEVAGRYVEVWRQ